MIMLKFANVKQIKVFICKVTDFNYKIRNIKVGWFANMKFFEIKTCWTKSLKHNNRNYKITLN